MRCAFLVAAVSMCLVSPADAGNHKHHKKRHADASAVKKVVRDAYVVGIHTAFDADAMRAGFHRDFTMFIRGDDGAVRKVSRDAWIARMEKGKLERAAKPKPRVKHKFLRVDVTGDVAVAKIAMYRDGAHIFTDYMSLYRFPDGWKIVAKVFQSHKRK